MNSVAVNTGARFSDLGFLQLIKRSENDFILAEHLGRRRDIPRHLFQQLIAKASDEVRKKLQIESGLRPAMQSPMSPDRCMRCLALRQKITLPPKRP